MVPAVFAKNIDKFPPGEIMTGAGCLVPQRNCIIDPAFA